MVQERCNDVIAVPEPVLVCEQQLLLEHVRKKLEHLIYILRCPESSMRCEDIRLRWENAVHVTKVGGPSQTQKAQNYACAQDSFECGSPSASTQTEHV